VHGAALAFADKRTRAGSLRAGHGLLHFCQCRLRHKLSRVRRHMHRAARNAPTVLRHRARPGL